MKRVNGYIILEYTYKVILSYSEISIKWLPLSGSNSGSNNYSYIIVHYFYRPDKSIAQNYETVKTFTVYSTASNMNYFTNMENEIMLHSIAHPCTPDRISLSVIFELLQSARR